MTVRAMIVLYSLLLAWMAMEPSMAVRSLPAAAGSQMDAQKDKGNIIDIEDNEDEDEAEDASEVITLKRALSIAQGQIAQLSEAVRGNLPEVQRRVSDFAADMASIAANMDGKILAELDVCEENTRAQIMVQVASFQSNAMLLADSAVEQWPEIKGKLAVFKAVTQKHVVALGKQLKVIVENSEEAQELVEQIRARISKLHAAALSQTSAMKLPEELAGFAEAVATFSGKVHVWVKDMSQKEEVQQALAVIQARAAQLVLEAKRRRPAVQEKLGEFATVAAKNMMAFGAKALEEVDMCNPEKKARVKLVLSRVESGVKQLMDAVDRRFPTIKETRAELVQSARDTLEQLKVFVTLKVQNTLQREDVQAVLAQLSAHVAFLQKANIEHEPLQKVQDTLGALYEHVRGWEEHNLLGWSEAKGEGCYMTDVKMHPVNMPGTSRSELESADACQIKCSATEGCQYWSYWPNGGCHLQDHTAQPRRALNVIAGPKEC